MALLSNRIFYALISESSSQTIHHRKDRMHQIQVAGVPILKFLQNYNSFDCWLPMHLKFVCVRAKVIIKWVRTLQQIVLS